ncbi:unnamed protein product, partial [Polarella glacialis]
MSLIALSKPVIPNCMVLRRSHGLIGHTFERRIFLVLLILTMTSVLSNWQHLRVDSTAALAQLGLRAGNYLGQRNMAHISCRQGHQQQLELQTSRLAAPRMTGDFLQRVRALAREALTWPHLPAWQRLEWAAALMLDVVPMKELPPWFLEKHNVSRRDIGVDLISLDGQRAVQCKCYNGTIPSRQIRHFLRVARWIFKANNCILVTSNTSKLTQSSSQELACQQADLQIVIGQDLERLATVVAVDASDVWDSSSGSDALPPLWPCQVECLKACQNGVRVIEMACSSGKTRVMYELSLAASGKVLVLVPSHVLLGQFSNIFPHFCQVGMGHNNGIDWNASGFIAVYNSVHLLANVSFSDVYVDEAHHPLPQGCPQADRMYRFSATHRLQPDFKYTMSQAIEDGVVCDYDIVIPIVTEGR